MFPRLKPVMIAIAIASIGFISPATRGTAKEYSSVIEQERTVERGSAVLVRNAFGDLRIAGSDRNTIEAIATNRNSSQRVPVSISEGPSGNKRVLIVTPIESSNFKQKIDLEIKVPRDVALEPIYVRSGNITVIDLNGGVSLRSDDGNIEVRRVGAPAGGLVELTAGSGNVSGSNINGDVRVFAISSHVAVQCVKGDVAARVSSGHIEVSNIDGDVELNVSSGSALFTGAIHPERRYRLKTLSGEVSMGVPDSVGFTAVLTSYSGQLETDFQFANDSQTPRRTNKRVIGKYGDGSGRIELDSFNGPVRLRRIAAGNGTDCQR